MIAFISDMVVYISRFPILFPSGRPVFPLDCSTELTQQSKLSKYLRTIPPYTVPVMLRRLGLYN